VSGSGAPELKVSAVGKKVFVVHTSWHTQVIDGLVSGANKELLAAGCEDINFLQVPGAFELPLAAKVAIESGADAVIALGVVIRGETPHFDYVCKAATDGLTILQLETSIPIGFGLLTVDTLQQALDRAGLAGSKENKGKEAVQAALHMLNLVR
jgi:6,7-dimethyl-8-ribityllumazine synthase